MDYLDNAAKKVCKDLLEDLIETSKEDNSIKFFRKDATTMLVWLFIIRAHSKKKKINIEDIARGISSSTTISKPSLRLILENAREKGFLKFTHSTSDNRSWIIEPEEISLNEFNLWTKNWPTNN